jgi:uncharacterized protein (DUF58 family)
LRRIEISSEDLARAAQLLLVRSLREATGLFAGNFVSAFRGSGLEFEESRPYVPGDDVRALDWNATARSGEPFVKRFREERNQTLVFGLDVSGSMRFGTTGRAKAATAVHALALMAVAAGRGGDCSGLVAFDRQIRAEVSVGRGVGHTAGLIRTAVVAASASGGGTDLAAGLRSIELATRQRAVIVLFSDFRDGSPLPEPSQTAPLRAALVRLTRRHDVVAAVLVDPREEELPSVGSVRIEDPERPGANLLLRTGSALARGRYRAACAARRMRLESELRSGGVEILWLRTDHSPLQALGRFFRERASRRSAVTA